MGGSKLYLPPKFYLRVARFVTITRYSVTLQAIYSELTEQLQKAEIEGLMDHEGFFTRRKRYNSYYWYFRKRAGKKHKDHYIGAETPELLAHIESLRARAADAKRAAKGRRELIRQLRTGGYITPDRRTGRVLEELANAGVFRLDGVLVGTHAFRCYPAILGTRLNLPLMATRDVDIAQDSVSLAITDTADSALGEALAKAGKFIEIPALNPKSPSTSWQTEDRELRVDVLTPLVGRARKDTIELPSLGAYAKALRFLDFLLMETLRAAVLTGSGVLARVPTPERYALHKLIIAQRRSAVERDKALKDLAQAQVLLEVLVEDRPDDIKDVWEDLGARGKTWKTEAIKSVRQLPKYVGEILGVSS